MTAPILVKDEKVHIGEWWLSLFQLSGARTSPDRQVTRESSFDSCGDSITAAGGNRGKWGGDKPLLLGPVAP